MEKYINIEDQHVCYKSTFEGNKAIVYLHGANSSRRIWHRQMSLQIEGFHNISIDLLGYGQSDKPEISYNLQLWLLCIEEILKEENIEEAILVAHSNGVILAKEFYRVHTKLIKGLVLLDGMIKNLIHPEALKWMKNTLERPDYEEYIEILTHQTPLEGLQEKDQQIIIEDSLNTPKYILEAQLDFISKEETWRPVQIDCPTLIIHTAKPLWTEEYLKSLEDIFKNYRLEDWGKVNHFLMLQEPKKLNQILSDFFNQ